ncbi:MAG: glycosyltransferase family 25 protein [Rubrivivax sp.]|nr:MAG: glycosyltransferase family 25 protein [Rubrivivax sp.]
MQILIINLPRHSDRLAFQTTQMNRLGLAYQLVKAVDAANLPDEHYQRLALTWERPLRKAEVCCFLSHVNAWQAVADSGQPALILEDDAVLADTVPRLLSELVSRQDIDLVVLEIRGRKKILGKQAMPITPEVNLLALFQDRTGSAGYVVWPSGARKLLDKADRGLAGPSDAFISSHYALRAMQVEPAAIVQLDMCEHYGLRPAAGGSSSIGNVGRPVTDQRSRGLFVYRRLMSQLRIGWRILSVWHKADRRHVRFDQNQFSNAQGVGPTSSASLAK